MTHVLVRPQRGDEAGPFLTAADVAAATGGRLLAQSNRPIRGGAVDSRAVEPGNLFVALPGERTDGHRFLADAVAAGAAALLVTQAPTDPAVLGDVTVVLAEDALPALHAVAASWRGRFSPLTVGITGSVAKTSTKEATAAVLGRRFVTLRTPGNQNNEIGLPLTLLRLGPEHGAAVLEMGMYTGGEIADLARIARPSIGVVTAVREIHLARAGSLDAIEAAKAELVEALPADGVAVLNADDERVSRMAARTAARVVTYGFSPVADVTAGAIVGRGFAGMGFQLRALGDMRAVATPALGRHGVHNALAGAAVGLAAGLTLDEIADGLAAGWSAEHRSQLVRVGEVAVIDDTYNASPPSMLAALDLLATLPGRRLAVLGEMLELGELSEAGHREVGGRAGRVVDTLVVVGEGASGIADAALEAGLAPERVRRAADRADALQMLAAELRPGDVVLFKASRAASLDLLVDALAGELRS